MLITYAVARVGPGACATDVRILHNQEYQKQQAERVLLKCYDWDQQYTKKDSITAVYIGFGMKEDNMIQP